MSLPRLNVFLSSTGRDLEAFRDAIIRQCHALDAYHLVHSEQFGARGRGAVEVCRERIGECHLLVGLIGHYRGWEPEGDAALRSITEMEYDWAGERDLERLMYVAPEGEGSADGLAGEPEKSARQQQFRTRVLAANLHDIRYFKGQFQTPDALAAAVLGGLANHWRSWVLRELQAGRIAVPPSAADGAPAGAAPSPVAALAELAKEADVEALLADPGKAGDVEAVITARAERRLDEARAAEVAAKAAAMAAAEDYARLGALNYGLDAAKAYRFYALAADTGAAPGTALFWLANTALAIGNSEAALEHMSGAVARLDDSEDADGAFWAFCGLGDLRRAVGELPRGLEAFHTAREIAVRALRLDPQNAR